MNFISTEFQDLYIIEPNIFEDQRGFFMESYNLRNFTAADLSFQFVQDNQSKSTYGVIRGLHFQNPPFAQTKLIRVLNGRILDVAVDLRKESETFGKSFSMELNNSNNLQLLIPKGFAHGFSVLSDSAEILYKCDNYYNKESEGGLLYNDPELNIDWRIEPKNSILSDKDKMLPVLNNLKSKF